MNYIKIKNQEYHTYLSIHSFLSYNLIIFCICIYKFKKINNGNVEQRSNKLVFLSFE